MPSWLNASGIATEDRREINPGLLGEPSAPSLREGLRSGRSDGHSGDGDALGGWPAKKRDSVTEDD